MWDCRAIGDCCWSWRFGDAPDLDLSVRLLALYRELKQDAPEAVRDVVPSYTELAVHFDSAQVDPEELREQVELRINTLWRDAPADAAPDQVHVLPVRYDGPDLAEVAAQTGLSSAEVVTLHAAPTYRVAMIGFRPYFPYLLGLDPRLETSRRATPRERVAAGTVAVAGVQTGVYPEASPGGWNLLGTTDPAVLREVHPGDGVRFAPVETPA